MPDPKKENKVFNHDVAAYVYKLNRFSFELHKSQSSAISAVGEFDQGRWSDYITAAEQYLDYINSEPHLDLPESNPMPIELSLIPDADLPAVENESIRDVCYLLKLAQVEALNSQSARTSTKFMPADEKRQRAILAKARSLLVNYVQVVTPLDMPESSPIREMGTHGKLGV